MESKRRILAMYSILILLFPYVKSQNCIVISGNWSTASLSESRYYFAATTVGNLALFAGGANSSSPAPHFSDRVDIFNITSGNWSTSSLSQPRCCLVATTVGNLALFAGGYSSSGSHYSDRVDIYNITSGNWSTASLSEARYFVAATTVGNLALFAGGDNGTGYSDRVDIYNATSGNWTISSLSQPRNELGATTVGNLALFAGGFYSSGNPLDTVDIYDAIFVCPSPSPSVTPSSSITPSITPTQSVSPSPSSSRSPSTSVTPSISVSPSVTPSVTPSPSMTPSITASITPSSSATLSSSPSQSPSSTPSNISEASNTKKKNNSVVIGAVVGTVGGAAFIALIIGITFVFKRTKQQDQDSSFITMEETKNDSNISKEVKPQQFMQSTNDDSPIPSKENNNNDSKRNTMEKLKSYMTLDLKIPEEELDKGIKLGEGNFGIVYKGTWRGGVVAIKEMKNVDDKAKKEFTSEAQLMKSIRPHSNVVQFLGICENPLMIITEFLERGSLRHFLETPEGKELNMKAQIEIMKGIASGMYHLASEGLVHRDLAARNILLSSNLTPKISDFGLSRLLGVHSDGKTYNPVGPLKWMAPENIHSLKYSEKSDVWSFGILYIEIITKQLPYPGMDGLQVATKVGALALKPTIPSECSDDLTKILDSCFEFEPQNRPDFKILYEWLKTLSS